MKKAAVIGLGNIGFFYSLDERRIQPASHLGCFHSFKENILPSYKLLEDIAICDVDTVKLAKATKIFGLNSENRFTDYTEMMEKFQPDIVSIATPTPTHYKITCDIANLGEQVGTKIILLEKPIAQNLEQAAAIIRICKHFKLKLAVNYSRRWSPLYWKVKRLMQTEIGEVVSLIGVHHGPLLRTGSHMLDLFDFLLEKPALTVQAFGDPEDNYLTLHSSDFNLNGNIVFETGVSAVLLSGPQKPYLLFELDILGTEGRIKVTDNGRNLAVYKSGASRFYEDIKELTINHTSTIPNENLLFGVIESLVRNAKIECTGEDAARTLRTALAIHCSSVNGNSIVAVKDVPEDYEVKSH